MVLKNINSGYKDENCDENYHSLLLIINVQIIEKDNTISDNSIKTKLYFILGK